MTKPAAGRSPVALVRAALDRAAALDPTLHAHLHVLGEQALADAGEAERELEAGRVRGPLHGLPIGVKGNLDVAGEPTTGASAALAARANPAPADADALGRLRSAGAVLVGVHDLDELMYGVTGENEAFGDVHNPHDPDRMAGGSSAGSATAVAAGMCVAALGTDTAGSVRIPAALCGVVGFKPTFGRVSTRGILPLSPSLDTVGVLAGSVRDAALVLDALLGDEGTGRSAEPPPRAPAIGVLDRSRLGPIDPAVASAVDAALDRATAGGARLVPVAAPGLDEAWRPIFTIVGAEAWARYGWLLEAEPGPGRRLRRSLEAGARISPDELAAARRERDRIAGALDAALGHLDALALPTVPVPAPPLGTRRIGEEPVGVTLLRLACPFNLSGQPAISLPCGRTPAGLPIGLQLVGRRYGDRRLLEIARALESALA